MTDKSQDSLPRQLADLLSTARERVEAGEFADALTTVRDAKRLHPRNVYVLAFERQVEQLAELSAAGKLGDDERTDIFESLPGIVDRALEGTGDIAPSAAPPKDQAAIERERAERAAAHEWLKNQYFQHAHDYVKDGEYDHALAEIRRVFIIDPENKIARDFELQIDELARIRKVTPAASEARGQSPRIAAAPPDRGQEPASLTASDEAPSGDGTEAAPARKKLKPLSVILLFLALALLAFATIFLIRKLETPAPQTPRSTISAPQREVFAPEQPPTPSDTSGTVPDTTLRR
jgi:tetratricopeptide (TPR) repeat protein